MRTLAALTVLLAANPAAAAGACEHPDTIAAAVRFVKHEPSVASTQKTSSAGGRFGQFDITVDIANGIKYSPDLIVLGSMEMLIAPRLIPGELQGKDLGREVSWSTLAYAENLKVEVLSSPRGCDTTTPRLFYLDLDDMIKAKFSERDELWPWMIRVRVAILDRDANVLARGEGTLKLDPKTGTDGGK